MGRGASEGGAGSPQPAWVSAWIAPARASVALNSGRLGEPAPPTEDRKTIGLSPLPFERKTLEDLYRARRRADRFAFAIDEGVHGEAGREQFVATLYFVLEADAEQRPLLQRGVNRDRVVVERGADVFRTHLQ